MTPGPCFNHVTEQNYSMQLIWVPRGEHHYHFIKYKSVNLNRRVGRVHARVSALGSWRWQRSLLERASACSLECRSHMEVCEKHPLEDAAHTSVTVTVTAVRSWGTGAASRQPSVQALCPLKALLLCSEVLLVLSKVLDQAQFLFLHFSLEKFHPVLNQHHNPNCLKRVLTGTSDPISPWDFPVRHSTIFWIQTYVCFRMNTVQHAPGLCALVAAWVVPSIW